MNEEYQEKVNMLNEAAAGISGSSALDDNPSSESPMLPKEYLDGLEITVTPDESENPTGSMEQDDLDADHPRKHKSDRASKRKAQVQRINQQKAELQSIAAYQAQQIEALQQQLNQASSHSIIQREKQLEERRDTVLSQLHLAKQEGDIDREVQATNLLSKFNAELAGLKQNNKVAPPSNYYVPEPIAYPQEDISNPVLEDIVFENEWLDQNSPNFDATLAREAVLAEEALIDKYRRSGKARDVGSYDFYKEVVNMVEKRNGISSPHLQNKSIYPPSARTMSNSRSQYTSPVNRNQSVGNIQQVGNRVNVTLNADQRDIAHRLPLFKPDGQPLSDQAKELKYAQSLIRMRNRNV